MDDTKMNLPIDGDDVPFVNADGTLNWEITNQVGVEISQPIARWMLENKRCAIIDLEANEAYSVTPGPAVL